MFIYIIGVLNVQRCNSDNPDSYDSDCDSFDEDILNNNGWSMDDTIYGISGGGCTLEVMSA